MYENCEFEENCRGGYMEVGTLLAIICPELRDQLISRRYFSIDGTLMRPGIQAADFGHVIVDRQLFFEAIDDIKRPGRQIDRARSARRQPNFKKGPHCRPMDPNEILATGPERR